MRKVLTRCVDFGAGRAIQETHDRTDTDTAHSWVRVRRDIMIAVIR